MSGTSATKTPRPTAVSIGFRLLMAQTGVAQSGPMLWRWRYPNSWVVRGREDGQRFAAVSPLAATVCASPSRARSERAWPERTWLSWT